MNKQMDSCQQRLHATQLPVQEFNVANDHVVIEIPERVKHKKHLQSKEYGCSDVFRKCFTAYMNKVVEYWTDKLSVEKDD